MAGIRIGAAAPIVTGGPPVSLYEGTVAPADADQGNVWRKVGGTWMRMTPFSSPTCTPICSDEPHTPRLSPDRTKIAYCDFDPEGSGSQQLRICEADGSQGDISAYPDTVLYDNGTEPEAGLWINHPCWRPDGNRLIFTDSSPDNGYGLGGVIKEVTYPGGIVTTLWTPDQQTSVQRENALHPWYSPDASKIAFFVEADAGAGCDGIGANPDCTRQGLWVMDADGSNDSKITGPWEAATSMAAVLYSGTQLAWSNDSEWIAFVKRSFGGSGDWGVYKIRPDGTDETLLLTANDDPFIQSYIGWGAWLPGDTELIVTHRNANLGDFGISIYRLAVDGSESKTMIHDGIAGASLGCDSGPRNTQNFTAAYRDLDRVWWIPGDSAGSGCIASCKTDGTDHVVDTITDSLIASGVGFEWV